MQLLHGRDAAPAAGEALRVGRAEVVLDGVDLRYLRLGGVELLRRLYVAVRDEDWGTAPVVESSTRVVHGDSSVRVEAQARHVAAPIDFAWEGRFELSDRGRLTVEFRGKALTAFRFNRIGLNVHHPPALTAGCRFVAEGPQGRTSGRLPAAVGPQRLGAGGLEALFPAFELLHLELPGDAHARFRFDGDLFEMEDQRNWGDGSFKTYSTPLAGPWPYRARAGQEVSQTITVDLQVPAASTVPRARRGVVEVTLGPVTAQMPPVGLGWRPHDRPLAPTDVELLRVLGPAHLRVDLSAGMDAAATVRRAAQDASALGCGLELALLLEPGDDLGWLDAVLDAAAHPVHRMLVLPRWKGSTTAEAVSAVRGRLTSALPGVPILAGTNAYFADLNRDRPDPGGTDGLAFPLCPQVHASDERSLTESVEVQADMVATARALAGDRPVVVSPVTLRPRHNPDATSAPSAERGPTAALARIDPRQPTLFAAAWTAASLGALAAADALTFFSTTGAEGVLAGEGYAQPFAGFPAAEGMVFGVFHVLADACAWRGAEVLRTTASDPLAVGGVAVRRATGTSVLLGNLQATTTPLRLGPLRGRWRRRVLDLGGARGALLDDPVAWRALSEPVEPHADAVALTLPPYAVVLLEGRDDAAPTGPQPW